MKIYLKNIKSITNQEKSKNNSKNKTSIHVTETPVHRGIAELISISNKKIKNIKLANLNPSHKKLNFEKSRQNSYNNISIKTEQYKPLTNILTSTKYITMDKKKNTSKTNTIKNSSNNVNSINEIIIIKTRKKNSITDNNTLGQIDKKLSNTNEVFNKKPLIRVQGKYKKKYNQAFSGYKRKNSLYNFKNINSKNINKHNKTSSYDKKELEKTNEISKNIIPVSKESKIIEYSNQILHKDKKSIDSYYYDNNKYNNQYLEMGNSNTNITSISNSINDNSLFNKTGNNFFKNNKIKTKFIKNNSNINDSKEKFININVNDEPSEKSQNINIKVKTAFKVPSSTTREKNVHNKDLIMIPLNKKNLIKPKSILNKTIHNKYKFHVNCININFKEVKSPSFVTNNKIILKNKTFKNNKINITTKHLNSELFLSNNANVNDNSINSNRILLNNSIISNINNKFYIDSKNKLSSEMTYKYNDEPMTIKELDDNYNDSAFVINIISNWGNKKQVGITEVEVFDYNNRKIKISECKIIGGEGSSSNLLFNNKMHSRNINEMWVCDINKNNTNTKINIFLYFYLVDNEENNNKWKNINYILIWNFNGWEVNKGIKKIEIYKEDKIFFDGVIPRGEHTIVTYQPYKIKFRKKYIIERNNSQQNKKICNSNSKNKNIILPFKSGINNSFDCHNKFKYKKNPRNYYHSLVKISSKKLNYDLGFKSCFSTFKNQYISSRSCNKHKLNNSYINVDISDHLKKQSENHTIISINKIYSMKKSSSFHEHKYININNNNTNNILYSISCNKIRINIKSNYGNLTDVGLTGINLIDNKNKKINIETAIAVGALPKDLRTVNENENDYRIFENLFNGYNKTTDENNMWLTLINSNPFIEICFDKKIFLSKIEIWNFNEPFSLDKCVREIEIIFDDDKKYDFILWKGLGIDYFDYFQTVKFENSQNFENFLEIQEISENLSNKLPFGFIFKIIFISNYGDSETISLKKMELFDENSELLNKYKLINDTNYTINLRDGIANDLLVDDYFYYHEYYDFHKNEYSICNNLIFICFEKIVGIKYIKLINTEDERFKLTSTREIQIYCDDVLIFQGVLKQIGENIVKFDENNEEIIEKNTYKEYIKDDIYQLCIDDV